MCTREYQSEVRRARKRSPDTYALLMLSLERLHAYGHCLTSWYTVAQRMTALETHSTLSAGSPLPAIASKGGSSVPEPRVRNA